MGWNERMGLVRATGLAVGHSIRWMMAELDRWPPQSTPPLARWLDTRLHHDGVVWDLVLHGMAWHGHGNLGPCEGNQPPPTQQATNLGGPQLRS